VRYADGTAFRRALADRLQRQYPDQDVGRLQKRVAMERFLARVVATLPERARLKGGYALELRLERARATQDLDVALRDLPGAEVLEALRDASELDLGDHLRYRIEETTRGAPQRAPDGGQRLTVVPELGGQRFMPFPLDVGVGDADSGAADVLSGGIDLSFADLAPLHVPAVSVAVHVAEKLHALSMPRKDGRENSRVKDLVDVVLLRQAALDDVEAVRLAVAATFERRATHELPQQIDLPLRSWASEYRKLAMDLALAPDVATVDQGAALLDQLVERIRSRPSG
jgi:hypothetical protein